MVELERRGIPTVVVATEKFEALARLEGQALGRSNLRMVVIPHPLGGQSSEEVLLKADAALSDVIREWGRKPVR